MISWKSKRPDIPFACTKVRPLSPARSSNQVDRAGRPTSAAARHPDKTTSDNTTHQGTRIERRHQKFNCAPNLKRRPTCTTVGRCHADPNVLFIEITGFPLNTL